MKGGGAWNQADSATLRTRTEHPSCHARVLFTGTAFAIYYENLTALIAFWVVLGLGVGVAGFQYVNKQFKSDKA